MNKIPYFDAHCDTVSFCCDNGRSLLDNDGHIALKDTGVFSAYAQLFALFSHVHDADSATRRASLTNMHTFFLQQMKQHSNLVRHCRGKQEVLETIREGKTAALLSIEETALLDFDPGMLEAAADWGVQFINLTWNHRNPLCGSCAEDPEQGLTDLGKAFVKEAQRLQIRMDVSHLSEQGFWDLCDLTEQPIVASHSNASSIFPHRRNLTDDQFRALAQTGGVAGLNFYRAFIGGGGDISALIGHLEHFLQLCGEDHVGLGGDLDGCSEICAGIDRLSGVPNLWTALKDRGYDDTLLNKLFFDNWMRIIRA